MWTVAGVAGAAWVGMAAYDHLSGRSFTSDNLERLRLAGRPLSAWAAHYQTNPRRASVAVCLTTTPSRLPHLGPTLASLFAQAIRPAEIRLHLPAWSCREGRAYTLPAWLSELPLHIVHTEDFGPATKLLPALREFAADQALLVVDDDKLYSSGLVAALAAAAEREPDVAWGSSGWLAPKDLTDRPTTLLSNLLQRAPTPIKSTRTKQAVTVDVLQGYSGYLVRPRFFDLERVFDYQGAPDAAFFVDDVWISAHCRVPKKVLPQVRYCFEPWSKRALHRSTSLGRVNRGDGTPAGRHNSVMLRHLAESWLFNARTEEHR
jgi:hypothetical protein